MKKVTRKFIAALSAFMMSAVPMINSFSANAAVTQYKTYVLYSVANKPNITYFHFLLNYPASVKSEKSEATSLCKNGYFSPLISTSNYQEITYNGPAIGATGTLCSTKFIVPMNTESLYDVVSRSKVTIRDDDRITISPTSITIEEVLLGDVDLNGVVNDDDATLIMNALTNADKYKLSDKQRDAADVYSRGDGVTARDALTIQEYVQGQIAHF